jgi:hypothetical protein
MVGYLLTISRFVKPKYQIRKRDMLFIFGSKSLHAIFFDIYRKLLESL